jgi:2-methylisocitrate lyase-like PEP mutase family enzyme
MPRFLVESYVAESTAAFDDARERARLTAETGADVLYVESTYVPSDQTVLHLFDAPSVAVLDEAGRRAGLQFERIVEAVNERSPK